MQIQNTQSSTKTQSSIPDDIETSFEENIIGQSLPGRAGSKIDYTSPSFMQDAYLKANGYQPEIVIIVKYKPTRITSTFLPLADTFYKATQAGAMLSGELRNFLITTLMDQANKSATRSAENAGINTGKTSIKPVYDSYIYNTETQTYDVFFKLYFKDK